MSTPFSLSIFKSALNLNMEWHRLTGLSYDVCRVEISEVLVCLILTSNVATFLPLDPLWPEMASAVSLVYVQ